MSHITRINLVVKNLGALKLAAQSLGLEFAEGQLSYKWFGRFVGDSKLPAGVEIKDLGRCSHALRIPNNNTAYEVGVWQNQDGTFSLRYDFWQGGYGLEAAIGKNALKLVQAYAEAAATQQIAEQGDDLFYREVLPDGRIVLKANIVEQSF